MEYVICDIPWGLEKNLLVRHVACMGMGIVVYRVLVEKREGKTPLGKPWRIIIILIILIIIILLRWIFRKWDLPSQAKVLILGGDLRETQVDVQLSVSHSCV